MLSLRLLDPKTDSSLYEESYNWRKNKKHIQPDRMPFEVFASDNPLHLAVGLFNPEFIAIFFFIEIAPATFDSHFTSRKNVPREILVEGAKTVCELMLEHGAEELAARVLPVNTPLCRFVEELDFEFVSEISALQEVDTSYTLRPEPQTMRYYRRTRIPLIGDIAQTTIQ
jgi:hypothetical protein